MRTCTCISTLILSVSSRVNPLSGSRASSTDRNCVKPQSSASCAHLWLVSARHQHKQEASWEASWVGCCAGVCGKWGSYCIDTPPPHTHTHAVQAKWFSDSTKALQDILLQSGRDEAVRRFEIGLPPISIYKPS
jgi:hypothetical protein